MTTIVSLKTENKMFMACDSCVTWSEQYLLSSSSKIWKGNNFLMGCSGSLSLGQNIRYGMDIEMTPEPGETTDDIYKIMHRNFIPKLRDHLSRCNEISKSDYGYEKMSGDLLICYNGHIITVSEYFSILIQNTTFEALGSGNQFSKGYLANTTINTENARKCLTTAIETALKFDKCSRKPVVILEIMI